MAQVSQGKFRPHVRLDARIFTDFLPEISPYAFKVYATLKWHFHRRTGQCNPSYTTLARETGISRARIITCMKELADLKLIKLQPQWDGVGDRASNQYDLVDPEEIQLDPTPIELSRPAKLAQGG